MTKRSVTHNTFRLERVYPQRPARVFSAFADPAIKRRWFGDAPGWTSIRTSMDFRIGGREESVGRPNGGPLVAYTATYQDIVPDERIIYAYEMLFDDVRISVSIATIELTPEGTGTRLVLTEQGAYLDGRDEPAGREHGTRELLEALANAIAELN